MRALIFAAGRGERLRPITDQTPKPLVNVQGKPLIQYHLEALMKAGIKDLVINVSWLHDQIINFVTQLNSQAEFSSLNIQFSIEKDGPLETGGGMLKALPLLKKDKKDNKDDFFVVVNADIFTDFDFACLNQLQPNGLVNLVLVANPAHNPDGDFSLDSNNGHPSFLHLKQNDRQSFTYSGIGLYHHDLLFPPYPSQVFRIVPYIKAAIKSGRAAGQLHTGLWHDVGTIDRLNELNQME